MKLRANNNNIIIYNYYRYNNYIKYVIPKSFFQTKYNTKKISNIHTSSELECFYDKSVAKYYENQITHIQDTKDNRVITDMMMKKFTEILEESYNLIILKLKKLPFKTMRIFRLMDFIVVLMKDKKKEVITRHSNLGRNDVSFIR